MASGYKHFSHKHSLMMHEMPEGAEVLCSGCNSSAAKTIYICWQCNYYLHEQCFNATRSRKHPSHPQHHLTLVPYPTYPSNSFYCNSCNIIGTGFSYSCSDCDFDLHVQCAYSISSATNSHQPHHVSYPNQETIPIVPNSPSISFLAPVPIPTPIPVPAQFPVNVTQDSYMAQNVSTFVPHSAQNSFTGAQNAYISQSFTSVPIQIPTSIPVSTAIPNPIPTPIPVPTAIQNPNPIPTPIHVHAQHPINVTQDSYMAQNAHNSSIPQHVHIPSVFVPTSAPNSQLSHIGESGQNKTATPGIKHFSHPHGLVLVNIKHGKKNISCSGCQEILIGKGYACVEQNCGFQLDESCFNLDKEIQHKSHPPHPLTLLATSPYKNANGKFTCNACFKDGTGFNYHCSICEHDLHVKCANLSETVRRDDHEHVLKLFYECPLMGEEYTFFCDVCSRVVHRDHWTYYCKECDYGTHLDCVNRQVCDDTSQNHSDDARNAQERLEEAMEIARISAIARKNMLDNI